MSDIKSIVKECFNRLNSDVLYAVIWKEKNNWYYRTFWTSVYHEILEIDEDFLIKIEIIDSNAIVINGYIFFEMINISDLKSENFDLLNYIENEIYKYYLDSNNQYHISTFLKSHSSTSPQKAGDALKSIMFKAQETIVEKNKEIFQCTLQALEGERPMLRDDIIEIMENQLQLLSEFEGNYTVKEIYKISEQMLNISKFLLEAKLEANI